MKEIEIFLGDWARMFVGEVPGVFYIEVFIRTVFIYCLLVASFRVMGKRMSAQVSRNELAALVTLAAAIGVPLQQPDRGLLPGLLIALVVIGTGTAIARYSFRHRDFERATQGDMDIIVENGIIHKHTLQSILMSKNRLCAELRGSGIRHLGEVKRLYMEANGTFTLIKEEKPQAGLAIIPLWDEDLLAEQKKSRTIVCSECGAQQPVQKNECSNCGNRQWTNAIE